MTKNADQDEEQPQVQHHVLEERQRQHLADLRRPQIHDEAGGDGSDEQLQPQAHAAGEARRGAARHLQVVVIKADGAVADRHAQHDPDVGVAEVRPQQRRDDDAGDDHEPAHGRRADFGEVRLGAVVADRLPLALLDAQQIDDAGPEQHDEQQRGEDGAAGAEGDVFENVQDPDLIAEVHQLIQHPTLRTASAVCSRPAPMSTWGLRMLLFALGNQQVDQRRHA